MISTIRKPKLAPSMMCADFMELRKVLKLFENESIDYLHIDVMDGHYVPNFTLGVDFCRSMADNSHIPLDIHLMLDNSDQHIPHFCKFPGSVICFHPEVVYHPLRAIDTIRNNSCKPGIAVSPSINLDAVKALLPSVDMVCLMTVNPGYAGQSLIKGGLEKIKEFRDYIDQNGLEVEIEIDGNVSWDNIPLMLDSGADILVTGSSSLFDPRCTLKENIPKLKSMLYNTKRY